MKTYEDFLREKIITSNGDEASFTEEDKKIYILSGDKKIFFKMNFREDCYDALLVAAIELLETVNVYGL